MSDARLTRSPTARTTARKSVAAIGSGLDRGLPRWRESLTSGLTVFIFHEVTGTPSAHQRAGAAYTSPSAFRREVEWIRSRFSIIEPVRLDQLGGSGQLPPNAALITFDDAWAGVFRVGLRILEQMGLPALCFLNMGTVAGDPDLAAVRRYEDQSARPPHLGLADEVESAARIVAVIRDRYGDDPEFKAFQGETASYEDLQIAARSEAVWFASHLYHHWDLRAIGRAVYEDSLRRNADALAAYPNKLPAFATPYGYADDFGRDGFAAPRRLGIRAVFTGAGGQNRAPDRVVLDRLGLPPEPSTRRDWWYATHRGRLLPRIAN